MHILIANGYCSSDILGTHGLARTIFEISVAENAE